jgi:hypothetical protein
LDGLLPDFRFTAIGWKSAALFQHTERFAAIVTGVEFQNQRSGHEYRDGT